jgi:dATP pyrophosphohydrolase
MNMNYIQAHIAAKCPTTGEWLYLALKRAETMHFFPGVWQPVTGTIDENEIAIDAAIREVKEETKLTIKKMWGVPFVARFYIPEYNQISLSPVFGFEVSFSDNIELSSEHTHYQWLPFPKFIDLLDLPSHIEGTQYFEKYIISNKRNNLFLLKSFE